MNLNIQLFVTDKPQKVHFFLVNKWNKKGQLVDVFEIVANTFKEAKDRIING